ncbi:chorismate-binding protein [Micromonospora sp. C32]|uniref:anthranilate synthase family protein n=1 Tax=unclassified Micromonospora TaxID=2617518 RepID=UPI001B38F55F|nr:MULTISPECIES: anthranilate synthase family protein [unclassified Micromonospora]MBQ1041659.1 chorismate-binding protein [Micromonospora sp. C72]MBQ1053296.1 chorismate-binding protein [Micromonospora sp. C32]
MDRTDSNVAGFPDLLSGLGGDGRAFALLHRPGAAGCAYVEVLTGEVCDVDTLGGLPLPAEPATGARHDLLVAVPYRQVTERGYDCHDDGAPLLAMRVHEQFGLDRGQALAGLPERGVPVTDADFDLSDEDYAAIVKRVVGDEIGLGAGSNFVIRRTFTARLADCSVATELALFRRLLTGELGSYWTFLFHSGAGTFIGASPERHVSMIDGTVSMNPISGTYRHPPNGPAVSGLLEFLNDRKEANELYMVVDEELKMMARMCASGGGQVHGPFLKEMARVTHSEYILTGRSELDVRDVLRETLLAPTVTGSPIENAFRVITRHETTGRGYYGGVLALIGRDSAGSRTLDSAIMIRTAEIDGAGTLRLGVGATLVRDSKPESEVAETRAKAGAMRAALGLGVDPDGPDGGRTTALRARSSLATDPRVRRALRERNTTLSRFWLDGAERRTPNPALTGRRVLVVDNEDTFMAMLDHQLRALGLRSSIARFDSPLRPEGHDLVVVGPGPGDPGDLTDPRMRTLRGLTRDLLAGSVPFLSICLGHQVLAAELGFPLARRAVPNQGVQKRIDLFGRPELVGFYNTYTARSAHDVVAGGRRGPIEISRSPDSGDVHALRGAGFRSVQFHLESVLTQHGPQILGDLLVSLLADGAGAAAAEAAGRRGTRQ